MNESMSRRRFLLFTGTGVIMAAGAALGIRELVKLVQAHTTTFRAVAGLPREPLPAYASYVIDGQVNPDKSNGKLTLTILAGAPGVRRPIPLLSRTAHVTSIQDINGIRHISAAYDSSVQLQAGEVATFIITIDASHHLAQTTFFGSPIQMRLEQWNASA